jgi:hypothetical protein
MTWFMQWVYEPNHPVYQNTYNFTDIGGGNWLVGFRAKQTQTNAPYFKMPIELRITFSSGPDTLIRVMNTVNEETYGFVFNRQPVSLQFDPGNNIVIKQGTTSAGMTVSAPVLVSPPNGAIDQPLTVELRWNGVVSAATYRLQVATDTLFGSIVYNDSTLTDTARQVGPLAVNTQYYWRVNAKNAGGTSAWSTRWGFRTTSQNAVVDGRGLPLEFSLSQNYPNPFNPSTVITYGLPHSAHVTISVYNVLGERVALLVNARKEAGYHDAVFQNPGLASGVYMYRLQADEFVQSRKLLLLK